MKVIVPDMSCGHCEKRITKALNEIGVNQINVNLDTKEVTMELGSINEQDAINAIEKAGYKVQK